MRVDIKNLVSIREAVENSPKIARVDIKDLVSIREVVENFPEIARIVDNNGVAVILENDAPRYILLDYAKFQEHGIANSTDLESVADHFLAKHKRAFEELAK